MCYVLLFISSVCPFPSFLTFTCFVHESSRLKTCVTCSCSVSLRQSCSSCSSPSFGLNPFNKSFFLLWAAYYWSLLNVSTCPPFVSVVCLPFDQSWQPVCFRIEFKILLVGWPGFRLYFRTLNFVRNLCALWDHRLWTSLLQCPVRVLTIRTPGLWPDLPEEIRTESVSSFKVKLSAKSNQGFICDCIWVKHSSKCIITTKEAL